MASNDPKPVITMAKGFVGTSMPNVEVFGGPHLVGPNLDDLRASIDAAAQAPDVVHVFRRFPEAATSDRRAPRAFVPDDMMAIEPRALERMFFPSFFDDDGDDDLPYEMQGSVAIVDIDGPLSQRGGWLWDGYDAISERFEAALEDENVGAVVLKINSPGGVCSGCFSTARSMRQAKAEAGKPVYAYADESAYSAAYAMASVADKIYLPREGGVGSVGVLGTLEDWTGYNEKVGIKVAVITSGKFKAEGHPDLPLKADVITRYQKRIDTLGMYFAELVAESRTMTTADVLKLEASCFYGEDAIVAGLADAVSSLDEVVDMAIVAAARNTIANTRTPAAQAAAQNAAPATHRVIKVTR